MKTALITGASRGIGEAAAYQLAKEYDCVAIMSRNTDGKLNTVANQIHATTNCECIPFTGDVSDFAFVEELVFPCRQKTFESFVQFRHRFSF